MGLAKVGKYAVADSGDSMEVVERPRGGLSVVIVDGQGSGRSAKRISHQVAVKAATLIGDGARDGVVMRTLNDYLYAQRDGKVSATVTILTADLDGKALLASRNSNCPVIVGHQDGSLCVDSVATPIGTMRHNRPALNQWPLYPGSFLVGFTDGVSHSGKGVGRVPFSLEEFVALIDPTLHPKEIASRLLNYAIEKEQGKPKDDMAVGVLFVSDREDALRVRRLSLSYPF